jgi:hypothetical protein
MAAIRALIDHQLGTLQHLNSLSKVDDESALAISADQKIFHVEELLMRAAVGLQDRRRTL